MLRPAADPARTAGRFAVASSQETMVHRLEDAYLLRVGGDAYLVDPTACAAFEVDEEAAQLFSRLHALPADKAAKALSRPRTSAAVELARLVSEGYFRPGRGPRTPPSFSLAPREIQLALTSRCTLKCRYCYAHSARGAQGDERDMSREVIDATLEWAVSEFAGAAEAVSIWTGASGEAMLYPEGLSYIEERVRTVGEQAGKNVSVGVYNTNLTLAGDPAFDARVTDGSCGWTLSLDGPQHVHDAMRVFPDGRGSYDSIAPVAADLVRRDALNYTAAATVTGAHPDITEIFLHLHGLGFHWIYLRPVRAHPEEPFAINADTIEAVKQGYRAFAEFLLAQDDHALLSYLLPMWHPLDYFGRFLIRVRARAGTPYRCPAGKITVGVGVNGDLYPCGSMIGLPGQRIGTVFDGLSEEARRTYREELLVTRKSVCQECWARHFCGGGCYHAAALVNGTVMEADSYDCDLTRHVIELAIMVIGRLSRERPNIFPALASLASSATSPGSEWIGRAESAG